MDVDGFLAAKIMSRKGAVLEAYHELLTYEATVKGNKDGVDENNEEGGEGQGG